MNDALTAKTQEIYYIIKTINDLRDTIYYFEKDQKDNETAQALTRLLSKLKERVKKLEKEY